MAQASAVRYGKPYLILSALPLLLCHFPARRPHVLRIPSCLVCCRIHPSSESSPSTIEDVPIVEAFDYDDVNQEVRVQDRDWSRSHGERAHGWGHVPFWNTLLLCR